LFLDTNISAAALYSESTYVENPLVTEITKMEGLVEILELEKDIPKIKEFCKAPTEDLLEDLSYSTKIVLLEEAFKKRINDEPVNESSEMLLQQFDSDIYQMKDGVYVHILYTEEFKGVSYDITGKKLQSTGKMRIYDVNENSWSLVTDSDLEDKYIEEIKTHIKIRKGDEKKLLGKYGIYGTVSKKDKKFRVTLKPEKGKETKGLVCSNDIDIIGIFINKLKRFPKVDAHYQKIKREDLIKRIKGIQKFEKYKKNLEDKDDDYLRGLLMVLTLSENELCLKLRNLLADMDLLIEN
jgi:hypothetical protein